MKKILLSVITAAALLAALTLPMFAADEKNDTGEETDYRLQYIVRDDEGNLHDKINYGTPVVDGKLDDIYSTSFQLRVRDVVTYRWGDGEFDSTTSGVVYALWDDAYFYFCAVIYDNTILSQGEEWLAENITNPAKAWINDDFELHLSWDKNEERGDKWGLDAYNYHIYTNMGTTYYPGYEEAFGTAVIDEEDGMYVVELAIPNAEGLEVGDEIGITAQINDLIDFAGKRGSARVCAFFASQQPWLYMYELDDTGENPHDVPIVRPTEAPTEAKTEALTDNATEDAQNPTETATKSSDNGGSDTKQGCGSTIYSTSAIVSVGLFSFVSLKKRYKKR